MKKKKSTFRFFIFILVIFVICAVYVSNQNREAVTVEEPESVDLELLALPSEENNIKHSGYTLCYSEEHEQPLWVAYVLTPQEVNAPSIKRKDNFRADPAIPTGSATLADYKGSGYDRGHLAPYADLSWSEESGNDSFFLSNMSPQNGSFNRGKWAELEKTVRSFAENEPMCIVTGPVLSDGPFETIGENEVSVPHYFYKVILDYYGEEIKAIGFILPNEKCSGQLSEYAVSVDYVEALTGLDFFSLLPDSIENAVEADFNCLLWGL